LASPELASKYASRSDIDFICNLMLESGALAMSMRERLAVSEKAPGDLVTDADRAISRLIVKALSERMPHDKIISEEGDQQNGAHERIWLIDPIDGTDRYIKNCTQFSVMIGLVCQGNPCLGWVYQPSEKLLYFGGPDCGTFRQEGTQALSQVHCSTTVNERKKLRLIIGKGDLRKHSWLESVPDLHTRFVGSMGVKVIWVLEDRADMVAQLHGRMSVWDTAGPAAVALGGGLEVGSGDEFAAGLSFPNNYTRDNLKQAFPIVVGKPGTLSWSRQHILRPTTR
jgi:3'(2'), 5'-bisphosphate nucleotidase